MGKKRKEAKKTICSHWSDSESAERLGRKIKRLIGELLKVGGSIEQGNDTLALLEQLRTIGTKLSKLEQEILIEHFQSEFEELLPNSENAELLEILFEKQGR